MSTAHATEARDERREVVAAKAGDESAFTSLVERYRRELQIHCYRMLGSLEDSEDLVQETFLRAWRKRASFEGRSSFRTWLYRIATNACLDALARSNRRLPAPEAMGTDPGLEAPSTSEVPWLQPYPDRLLEGIAPSDEQPEAAIVAKETIELAFLVAIQHLPPRQRAVLIVRDALGWSAKETAALLEASVASVNSALQRARATLRKHLPERRLEWAAGTDPSAEEQKLVQRYVEATERADADALLELMREDARFWMPPEPGLWLGRESIVAAWKEGGFGTPEWRDFRCEVTRANGQPAVACYRRRPGEREYRPLALDVLRVAEGRVAEIVTFPSELFPAFELPPMH
ncbi:MAG: sigma-70 family RNA polymerase sigma factor [Solirubrobacterales bacterium]